MMGPLEVKRGWRMRLVEVKAMAEEMGLRPGRKRKAQLIREIQAKEGNIPCFGTSRMENCRKG